MDFEEARKVLKVILPLGALALLKIFILIVPVFRVFVVYVELAEKDASTELKVALDEGLAHLMDSARQSLDIGEFLRVAF